MKYLQSDPDIAGGELTIKGTRITIALVFHKLAAGMSVEYMLEGWPWLTREELSGGIDEAIQQLEAPQREITSSHA